jgi:hypothetical protein
MTTKPYTDDATAEPDLEVGDCDDAVNDAKSGTNEEAESSQQMESYAPSTSVRCLPPRTSR